MNQNMYMNMSAAMASAGNNPGVVGVGLEYHGGMTGGFGHDVDSSRMARANNPRFNNPMDSNFAKKELKKFTSNNNSNSSSNSNSNVNMSLTSGGVPANVMYSAGSIPIAPTLQFPGDVNDTSGVVMMNFSSYEEMSYERGPPRNFSASGASGGSRAGVTNTSASAPYTAGTTSSAPTANSAVPSMETSQI